MSELIERVAFATCSSMPCICKNRAGFTGMPCLDRARRGIEAMRHPTQAMIDAAYLDTDIQGVRYHAGPEAYKLMIEEALE